MLTFDEILLSAVLVMLIASTFMAWKMQHSLDQSRRAFEALVKTMEIVTHDLEERVAELEDERA